MSEKQLADIAQRVWEEFLERSPSSAMLLGDHRYDDRIEDLTEEREDEMLASHDAFIAELKGIDAGALPEGGKITYSLLMHLLTSERAETEDRPLEMAAGIAGISDALFFVHPQTTLNTAAQADMLLRRIEGHAAFFRQAAERHRAGAARGRIATARNIGRTANQLEKYLKMDVRQDPLLGATLPKEMDQKQQDEWRNKAAQIVQDTVRPAVAEYAAFMRDELLPKGRPDDKCGIMWVEGGEALYAKALARHTDSPLHTADAVHEYGMAEIERLSHEFEEVGARVFGGKPSFAEVLHKMDTDPTMRYKNPEQMIKMAEDAIARAWPRMKEAFGILPEAPCKVVPVPPEAAEDAPPAFYYGPALDGSRPGMYYVNTHKAEEKSIFEAETIAFHEAVPGHHLDRTIAAELKGVPQFQREYCTTAFVEGWGLYAEQLANEMGLISNDVQQLGRLGNDAWRSCRLVLDTGMHHKGWDREKAMKFFRANSPVEEVNAETETDRYISWPGQACAYKMGQRKINELRARAEQVQGAGFSLSEFHDRVLKDGGMHLETLEEKFDRWLGDGGGS